MVQIEIAGAMLPIPTTVAVADRILDFADVSKVADMAEVCYQNCLDGARGQRELQDALRLEHDGGPCPRCGVPFVHIPCRVEAKDGTVFSGPGHHEPACGCFKRCEKAWVTFFDQGTRKYVTAWFRGCGKHLVAEVLLGLDHCSQCGGPASVPRSRRKAVGRKVSGKDLASGQEEDP